MRNNKNICENKISIFLRSLCIFNCRESCHTMHYCRRHRAMQCYFVCPRVKSLEHSVPGCVPWTNRLRKTQSQTGCWGWTNLLLTNRPGTHRTGDASYCPRNETSETFIFGDTSVRDTSSRHPSRPPTLFVTLVLTLNYSLKQGMVIGGCVPVIDVPRLGA